MESISGMDAEKALAKAKEYLAGSWLHLSVDDVLVTPMTGGYCSRLYLCQDKSGACEPSRFLIRLLGGKILEGETLKFYNEGTESIVFFFHGHLGYGPKLYGSFTGGRVEEYIPSRTATHADLENAHIRTQIARKVARFHSMKLPVSQKPFPPLEKIWRDYEAFDNPVGRKHFSELSAECQVDPDWINWIDLKAELDWVKQSLPKISGRLVLSFNDLNLLNCLIRETPDKLGEDVTLIDYELGGTNWRGADIGLHFNHYRIDFRKDGFRSGRDYPDAVIRRQFVTDYLNQIKELDCYDQFHDQGLDSVDHVLMEAEFHSLTFILLIYSFTVKPRPGNPIFEDRKEARTYLNWARDLTQFYIQHKDYFVDKYAAILENEEFEEMGDIRIAAALV